MKGIVYILEAMRNLEQIVGIKEHCQGRGLGGVKRVSAFLNLLLQDLKFACNFYLNISIRYYQPK